MLSLISTADIDYADTPVILRTMVSVLPVKPGHVRLQLLDTFRFVAAAAVLAYHWLFRGIETERLTSVTYSGPSQAASYGYVGVYLFFMISGFVIASSAQGGSPSRFAVGRLTRLYPAFWVAVLFTTSITVIWGGPALRVSLPQVVTNLTMVPGVLGQTLVDPSYWTLFHELLFYAMVFFVLLIGQGHRLDTLFPAWAIGMVVVTLTSPDLAQRPFLGTIYGFFAAGAILSTVQRHGWTWWRAVGLSATLVVVLTYVIRDVTRINAGARPFEQSMTVTIALVIVFYLALLIQISPRARNLVIPGSNLLGRLTYPVYLLHTYFGYIFLNHVATESNKWLVYLGAVVLVVGMAYLLHVLIEKRPRAAWFRFFDFIAGRPIRWVEARIPTRRRQDRAEHRSRSMP